MAMPTEDFIRKWSCSEAGRELDALVAEKVMGWHLEHMSSYSFQGWHDASGERTGWTETPDDYDSLRNFIGVWAPSTDIAAAWEVVEHITSRPLEGHVGRPMLHELRQCAGGQWQCSFCSDFGYTEPARAPTAPLAICRAALEASAQQRDRDDERDGHA